jgi:glycogen operon protein
MTAIGTLHPESGAFSEADRRSWANATWPSGARVADDGTCEFAVHSQAAERVLLELYDDAFGSEARYDYWMERGGDSIWRAKVRGVKPGRPYGFRAWGSNWPWHDSWRRGNSNAGFLRDVDGSGARFNPNKLLYDPYARELSHDPDDALDATGNDGSAFASGGRDIDPRYAYRGALALGRETDCRDVDSGTIAQKSVVVLDRTPTGAKPRLAPEDVAVYEAHVRGLTAHPSASRLESYLARVPGFERVRDVPEALRGTYAGAAFMAPYLKALGYRAIEFLPVFERGDGRGNFWGYMTDGFFAPERDYAYDTSPGGPTAEFKRMVNAFHAEGIEVYLDVVYNHSGEGGLWNGDPSRARIACFRGLDNAGYYALPHGAPDRYWDASGCGNELDAGSLATRSLVLDSLAYWCDEMGVDGFRFDLAPILGRTRGRGFGFDANAALLEDIARFAASRNIEAIAEAWDCAADGYQVSRFPDGWGEWNGRFRDSLRALMRSRLDGPISPADALHGDFSGYADQGGARRSVNFACAHDGFTLADLVSYSHKRNDGAWPFGPSDGGSDSAGSWDSSWVPPASSCPDVPAFRRQRIRNFVAFLFASRGVPMTVYGDEFGRGQNGNNNPYNLDTVATWNNYAMIASDAPQREPTLFEGEPYFDCLGEDSHGDGLNALFLFHRYVARLRASSPALRQGNYGMPIAYAKPDLSEGFDSREDLAFQARLDGSEVGDRDFLLLVNMSYDEVRFALPPCDSGDEWARLVDTAYWAEVHDNCWDAADAMAIEGEYWLKAHSIALFAAR